MAELGNQFEDALMIAVQKVVEDSLDKAIEKAVEHALSNRRIAGQGVDTEYPLYYTRQDIAQLLGISMSTIVRWEEEGKLQSEKIRGRRLYRRSEIEGLRKSGLLLKYGVNKQ